MDDKITLEKEDKSSIELKKSIKGEFSWNLKIYFDQDYNKAIDELERINKQLQARFI